MEEIIMSGEGGEFQSPSPEEMGISKKAESQNSPEIQAKLAGAEASGPERRPTPAPSKMKPPEKQGLAPSPAPASSPESVEGKPSVEDESEKKERQVRSFIMTEKGPEPCFVSEEPFEKEDGKFYANVDVIAGEDEDGQPVWGKSEQPVEMIASSDLSREVAEGGDDRLLFDPETGDYKEVKVSDYLKKGDGKEFGVVFDEEAKTIDIVPLDELETKEGLEEREEAFSDIESGRVKEGYKKLVKMGEIEADEGEVENMAQKYEELNNELGKPKDQVDRAGLAKKIADLKESMGQSMPKEAGELLDKSFRASMAAGGWDEGEINEILDEAKKAGVGSVPVEGGAEGEVLPVPYQEIMDKVKEVTKDEPGTSDEANKKNKELKDLLGKLGKLEGGGLKLAGWSWKLIKFAIIASIVSYVGLYTQLSKRLQQGQR